MVAFQDLCTERSMGASRAGPIPWSKIVMYAQVRQMDYESYLVMERLVRAMENRYADWEEQEAGKDARRQARAARRAAPAKPRVRW